jgi:hypothetical protein
MRLKMSLRSQRQARGSRKQEGRQTYHVMASLERSVVLQLSLVHPVNQPGEDQTHVSSFVHDRRLQRFHPYRQLLILLNG